MISSDIATVVGTHIGYVGLTFLPPVLWLLFYLREDKNPEPGRLITLTFMGGVISAIAALFIECGFVQFMEAGSCGEAAGVMQITTMLIFGLACIEEVCKYLAVRILILNRGDFDEPIDAMIYMMTAALGFAALENLLFIFPWFSGNAFISAPFLQGIENLTDRFLGANLLHALASGVVGYFLARTYLHPNRNFFIIVGILLATVLHTSFNYLILMDDALPQGVYYISFLLLIMAVMIFIDFEKLKKVRINFIR